WERAEVWPSLTQLHTLCYALAAEEEELLALTTGRLTLGTVSGKISLEESRARCYALSLYSGDPQAEKLKELGSLTLEAQTWPLATQSGAGRQLLATIYAYHANHCSSLDRFAEAGVYAERALEIVSEETQPDPIGVRAALALARSAV